MFFGESLNVFHSKLVFFCSKLTNLKKGKKITRLIPGKLFWGWKYQQITKANNMIVLIKVFCVHASKKLRMAWFQDFAMLMIWDLSIWKSYPIESLIHKAKLTWFQIYVYHELWKLDYFPTSFWNTIFLILWPGNSKISKFFKSKMLSNWPIWDLTFKL